MIPSTTQKKKEKSGRRHPIAHHSTGNSDMQIYGEEIGEKEKNALITMKGRQEKKKKVWHE